MSVKEFQDKEQDRRKRTKLNNGDVRVFEKNSTGAKNGSWSVASFVCHSEGFSLKNPGKHNNFPNYDVQDLSDKSNGLDSSLTSFVQNDKQSAFTLAETLITLVIIGVVAALTVPNLIVKYQKGPNRYGRDVFMLHLYQTVNTLYSNSYTRSKITKFEFTGSGFDRNSLLNASWGCKKSDSSVFAGRFCGALIMNDGWQIKDDYPW